MLMAHEMDFVLWMFHHEAYEAEKEKGWTESLLQPKL